MKTLRFLFLLSAVSLAFVSCSKDEDAPSVSGNKYEATYAKIVVTGSFSATFEFKTKAELQENEIYEVIDFKSNGDFYVDDSMVGTWAQSDSKVTITSGSEKITVTVSGNVVKRTETDTEDGDTYNMEVHYTKI
jgi:hypothetical protein